jgi:hypothetical protein
VVAYRTGATTAYGFEVTDQHGTSELRLDYTAQVPTWRQETPYGAPWCHRLVAGQPSVLEQAW